MRCKLPSIRVAHGEEFRTQSNSSAYRCPLSLAYIICTPRPCKSVGKSVDNMLYCADVDRIDVNRYPGGATLILPSERIITGSLTLRSNLTLHIPPGGLIDGSHNPTEYPLVPPLPSYGTARDNARNVSVVHRALLYGRSLFMKPMRFFM